MQSIQTYLAGIQSVLKSNEATEHSYRPVLKDLFESIFDYTIINEPRRSEHGAPDFIFKDGFIPVAWWEHKDLKVSLDKIEKWEQLSRYFGYTKLFLTNWLEFRFYKNGYRYGEPIILWVLEWGYIQPQSENFDLFVRTFTDFIITDRGENIRSASHLAQIMWWRWQRIRDTVATMLAHTEGDPTKFENLQRIKNIFTSLLINDLDNKKFADIYAQTLIYGLFVARYHDSTPENFSRQEARDLLSLTNPLLRDFFDHVTGTGFESSLAHIVDEMCEIFGNTNISHMMHWLYQKADIATHDPVIHFYEDFLKEYDPALRMERGVFYTPAPVVRFIVRSVDDVLKKHFHLSKWLADTSEIPYKRLLKIDNKWKEIWDTKNIHRVQILDPATGTGTFLNEIIHYIYSKMSGQAGMWGSYVENGLLPRLHGFELMMASYTIAHMKLWLTLAETGITNLKKPFQIYLTNSLEEAKTNEEVQQNIFNIGLVHSITEEAIRADEVKRNKPIMVVIGNPPYSGISTNTGKWITDKIEDYKYIDGVHFGERKHWLQDDYVKFFRLAESMVEKNTEWVLAYITNHGYLDNPTFRGMRWHLLTTFDHIYIVDLHGNSKKKETARDGSKDENVFDIMQGTAIFIGVKTGKKKTGEVATVEHIDIYGKRKEKYDWLENNSLESATSLVPVAPYYFFVPKNTNGQEEYERGFSVNEIFPVNVTGIQTGNDDILTDDSVDILEERLSRLNEWNIWKILLRELSYRPFDFKNCYYIEWLSKNPYPKIQIPASYRPRYEVMKNFTKENLGLIVWRQGQVTGNESWNLVYITKTISDLNIFYRWGGVNFPLYLYSDSTTLDGSTRTANLDPVIWQAINEIVGETTPEQILDYIYAVLHSPSYRDKYREFLKIDFPRVPYPRDREQFLSLVALGGELRSLHLLESPKVDEHTMRYPVVWSNIVDKISYVDERVYINQEQYICDVPQVAWEFHIWGYQPAQKWLKDRKWRTLTWEDIGHYQQMIVALRETSRVMGEVDEVLEV